MLACSFVVLHAAALAPAPGRPTAHRVPLRPRASARMVHASCARYTEIEGLADQVWQLRTDGIEIHETVVRSLEAEIARLQLEEALDEHRSARRQLWSPADSCDPFAGELRTRLRSRAAAAMRTTAVPPLGLGSECDAAQAPAAALASSVRAVLAALTVYVRFSTASVWAVSSANFAGASADVLRLVPRHHPLAPLVRRALRRCLGSAWVPKLGANPGSRPSRVRRRGS